jgi:hypothetical protein
VPSLCPEEGTFLTHSVLGSCSFMFLASPMQLREEVLYWVVEGGFLKDTLFILYACQSSYLAKWHLP